MTDSPEHHEESAPPADQAGGRSIDDGKGRVFPCAQCGADMTFYIGEQSLKCPYCAAVQEISLDPQAAIEEQDFEETLSRLEDQKAAASQDTEHNVLRCEACGGDVLFDGTLTSTLCPYCGAAIQQDKVHRGGFRVPVEGVLPFRVQREKAEAVLKDWVRTRWFAPGDFQRIDFEERFNGVYLPFWTFDSLTFTHYEGERGDNDSVTVGSGKDQRTETRVRWQSASGEFQQFFNDILVNATHGLPVKVINELVPWAWEHCRPFRGEYLAGFFARTYDIDPEQGFVVARHRIENVLQAECRQRIGGDQQRLHDMQCRYDAVTFKHLLLPVWMLAYRYRDKSFRVFVNASTGEVQGERPYSNLKIALAVCAGLLLAAVIVMIIQQNQ